MGSLCYEMFYILTASLLCIPLNKKSNSIIQYFKAFLILVVLTKITKIEEIPLPKVQLFYFKK